MYVFVVHVSIINVHVANVCQAIYLNEWSTKGTNVTNSNSDTRPYQRNCFSYDLAPRDISGYKSSRFKYFAK